MKRFVQSSPGRLFPESIDESPFCHLSTDRANGTA